MTRLIGPDEACREVKTIVTSAGVTKGLFKSKALKTATYYTDPDQTATPTVDMLTELADILDLDDAAITDSTVTIDAYSMLPLMQFPDGADSLLVVVDSGPPWRVYPRSDDQFDALETRVTAVEAGGSGDTLLVHKAGAEAITGVKTFSASPVVPAPTTASQATTKTYVDAGDTAVTTAAAADATSKVAAEATTRAAADTTLSGLITAEAAARAAADTAAIATAATDATTKANAAQAAAIAASNQRASNLSDVANAGTARTNLGLGNVDNTSDANKPISTATATALTALDLLYVKRGESFISITDAAYGADATGSADSTTAIATAITAATTFGLRVLAPPGTYKVTPDAITKRCIALPATFRGIFGLNAYSTKIKVASGVGSYHSVIDNYGQTDVSGIVLDGFTIDQNTTGNVVADVSPSGPLFNGYPRFAVNLVKSTMTKVTVRNIRVIDSDNVNTIVFGGKDVTIDDNELSCATSSGDHDHSAIYTQIYLAGGKATITNNVIYSPAVGTAGARTAIETHGGAQDVSGNIVRNYSKFANITGVDTTPGDGIHVVKNSANGCRYGVTLWSYTYSTNTTNGLANCHVRGNTIRLDPNGWSPSGGAESRGIFIDGSSPLPFEDIFIENNTIRYVAGYTGTTGDTHAHGIDWFRSTSPNSGHDRNIVIRNNIIDSPTASGIRVSNLVSDYAQGMTITGNTIRNPGQGTVAAGGTLSNGYANGIMIAGQLKDSEISGNLILDDQNTPTTQDGIYLVAANAGSANNLCSGNIIPAANNRRIEMSASVSGGWLVKADYESLANTPAGIARYGSTVNVTSTGVTYMQTTAPEGTAWTSIVPLGVRAADTTIFRSTRYYSAAGGRTTAILVQSTEYASPLWVGETVILDKIGIEITAVAGVTAGHVTRLGIRADDGNGVPGTLVVDAGTVASDAVATVEATINVTLTPGLYWLTGTPQFAGTQPTYRCLTGTTTSRPVGAGSLAQATASTQMCSYTATGVTGGLGTFTLANNVQAGLLVVVRAASGQ